MTKAQKEKGEEMKIEIDLNQIFGDENGVETLADSIRRQVTEKLSEDVTAKIGEKIDIELAKLLRDTIKNSMETLMPNTISALMSQEYIPVDRYGDRRDKPTTFRKELVAAIHEQMIYKKTSYESERNAFTKAVDSVVSENVKLFEKSFNTLVNEMFTKSCFEYAKTELQKKLGVK